MEKKKRSAKKIIIASAVCLAAVGIITYFIFENSMKGDFGNGRPMGGNNFPMNNSEMRGGFQQLDDTTKNQITSFFEGSPPSSEVETYCNENGNYCFYYCIDMKGTNDFCTELLNNTQMPPGGEPLHE